MVEAVASSKRGIRLDTPGRIGSMVLPHRILMGAMHLGIEAETEQLERLTAFYVERVAGGAALIITGGVAVSPEGGGDHMFCLQDPADQRALAAVAAGVHRAGGRIALQLFHGGRYATARETGLAPVAPSACASRITNEVPLELSQDGIERIVLAFACGARTAQELGYDAVEVMASEGYLLNEFMSPLTNLRSDAYGGDLDGRMRLSLDVIAAMRDRVGRDYPILFRMSGDDCMPGSTTREETLQYTRALCAAGVDALNIGIGWHESRVPTVAAVVPRAGFADVGGAIRAVATVPVLLANRVNVPEVAQALLAQAACDFVAPARPWLADPEFALKALTGDRRGLNVCVACNQACLDHTLAQPPQPVSCMVNPRAGLEHVRPLTPAPEHKRVAVVGAGPAGLEAARAAAQRGHRVTLFEARAAIGGQLRLAARVPDKQEFWETIRYYEEMLQRLDVHVELAAEPTVSDLLAFDAVILAQGVVPRVPDVRGTDLPHVRTYAALLEETGESSAATATGAVRTVVIGAGGVGCDVVKFLYNPARLVTLAARSQRVGARIGRTTRWIVREELRRPGIELVTDFSPQEIAADGVYGSTPQGARFLAADRVVLCTGQDSRCEWMSELTGRVELHVVGGARDARGINAVRAIAQGQAAALAL